VNFLISLCVICDVRVVKLREKEGFLKLCLLDSLVKMHSVSAFFLFFAVKGFTAIAVYCCMGNPAYVSQQNPRCEISGFRRGIVEDFAVLQCYAVYVDSC
jgi:hypothetical protein